MKIVNVHFSAVIFSVLQHIEDLTKEKFSLQRALQTAQTLAESLAAENSSLTDSFNQQVCSLTMDWQFLCMLMSKLIV